MSNSDIAVLREMLNSGAVGDEMLKEHDSAKTAVLEEKDQNASGSVEIRQVPEDAVIVKVDARLHNRKLFSGRNGMCKRSDFMIISEEAGVVLFVELKSGNSDTRKSIVEQLRGSLCVFHYCQSVACNFFGKKGFMSSYKKRYVAFVNLGHIKRRTGIVRPPSGTHDTPLDVWKIRSNLVSFSKIAK